MSEGGGQQGPSMDEILASIRKIISEDDDGQKSDMKGVPHDTVGGDDSELVLEDEVPGEDDDEEEIELVDEVKDDVSNPDGGLEKKPEEANEKREEGLRLVLLMPEAGR